MSAGVSPFVSAVLWAYLVKPASAAISWNQAIEAHLRKAGDVTFDPLGVAAILQNPRADGSATKLYTQYHHKSFRWPHLTMVGATLTPIQVLVDHLTNSFSSIHPAITMCTKDERTITVKTNMIFKEWALNASNDGLLPFIRFKSSEQVTTDFQVVFVSDMEIADTKIPFKDRLIQGCIFSVGILNGLALFGATILGGFIRSDIWAILLFSIFSLHWLFSTLVSRTQLVVPSFPSIDHNEEPRYLFYERPEGGTVVFKGCQDTLEKWARMKWEYNRTWYNDILHWSWIISGTMAAVASVACMVNMSSVFQLIFLGTLVYASVFEIIIYKLSQGLSATGFIALHDAAILANDTRSRAIIRSSLGINEECRLKLDWIDFKLLPPLDPFKNLQVFFDSMKDIPWNEIPLRAPPEIAKYQASVDAIETNNKQKRLAERILVEIRETVADIEKRQEHSKVATEKVSMK